MSRHASYGKTNSGDKKRNVLKRFERVRLLQAKGQWDDKKSVFALPKTKVLN